MARVMPFGEHNWSLKEMGRTNKAFMAVFNLSDGISFLGHQLVNVFCQIEVGPIGRSIAS
jgi:hypothetical protein